MTTRSPDDSAPRADAGPSGSTRERILEAARVMVAGGDMTPSLNDLARHAGVGVGTVYRHFATHDVLIEALADERLSEVVAGARVALTEPDPVVGLEQFVRATLRLVMADRCLGAVLRTEGSDRTGGRLAELEETVAVLLSRGRRAGALRPEVTARDLQRLLCGLDSAVRAGPDPDEAAARYVTILLAGLRVPAAPVVTTGKR